MFETIANNLFIISSLLWTLLGTYALWYMTKARDSEPMAPKEAQLLWRIHRQTDHCKAKTWSQIKRENQIIGFCCACGHEHIQKRPLISHLARNTFHTQKYMELLAS